MVELLLAIKKINTNIKDSNGRTPLSYAAECGHDTVVTLLLKQDDIEVDLEDNEGRTPLWYTVLKGNKAIIELLLATNKVNANLNELLTSAMEDDDLPVIKLLLRRKDLIADLEDDY